MNNFGAQVLVCGECAVRMCRLWRAHLGCSASMRTFGQPSGERRPVTEPAAGPLAGSLVGKGQQVGDARDLKDALNGARAAQQRQAVGVGARSSEGLQ